MIIHIKIHKFDFSIDFFYYRCYFSYGLYQKEKEEGQDVKKDKSQEKEEIKTKEEDNKDDNKEEKKRKY